MKVKKILVLIMAICFTNGMRAQDDFIIKTRQAAEKGSVVAQNKLGYYYKIGHGVAIDYNEAIRWWRKAAEKGNVESLYELGLCYYNGTGVNIDYIEAVKWWQKAANGGHFESRYKLGVCFYSGIGVNKNYTEAVKWFRKAAEQGYRGHDEAQFYLGTCYENGWGVNKNYDEAIRWYRKAAEQGLEKAQTKVNQLLKPNYDANLTIQSNGLLHKGTYISGTTQYDQKTGKQESRSPKTYEIEIYKDSIIVDGNTYGFISSEDGVLHYMGGYTSILSFLAPTICDWKVDANYKKIKLEQFTMLNLELLNPNPFSSVSDLVEPESIYYYLYEK